MVRVRVDRLPTPCAVPEGGLPGGDPIFMRHGQVARWSTQLGANRSGDPGAPTSGAWPAAGRWDRAETLRYRGVHRISHSATTRARAGLLMVGVTLLMTAWIAGTLPFDAPDEASH